MKWLRGWVAMILWLGMWAGTSVFVAVIFLKNAWTRPHRGSNKTAPAPVASEDVEVFPGGFSADEKRWLWGFIEKNVRPFDAARLNEGIGTAYDRFVLDEFFRRYVKEYGLQRVIEFPADGMTGIVGMNSVELGRLGVEVTLANPSPRMLDYGVDVWRHFGLEKQVRMLRGEMDRLPVEDGAFDLAWNFCMFERFQSPEILVREMARVSKRFVFICTQSKNTPGTPLHAWYHKIHGIEWDHGELEFMALPKIRQCVAAAGLEIVDEGGLDIPPWMDTQDMPLSTDIKTLLKPFGIKWDWSSSPKTNGTTSASASHGSSSSSSGTMQRLYELEQTLPRWFSLWQAHHYYILATKKKS